MTLPLMRTRFLITHGCGRLSTRFPLKVSSWSAGEPR